jgi:hypothetical protein
MREGRMLLRGSRPVAPGCCGHPKGTAVLHGSAVGTHVVAEVCMERGRLRGQGDGNGACSGVRMGSFSACSQDVRGSCKATFTTCLRVLTTTR